MKPRILLLLLLPAWLAACDPFGSDVDEFTVALDSVRIPDSVVDTDSIVVTMFGTTPNGCRQLHHIENRRILAEWDITPVGRVRAGTPCSDPAFKFTQAVGSPPPFGFPLAVIVRRGNGASFTKTVLKK